jgi:hypothetical protein
MMRPDWHVHACVEPAGWYIPQIPLRTQGLEETPCNGPKTEADWADTVQAAMMVAPEPQLHSFFF